MRITVLLVLLLGFFLAFCSEGGKGQSESPTIAAQRYGSVAGLRDAAVKAGYPCPNWKLREGPQYAKETGECSEKDVFSVYATDADLTDQLELSSQSGGADLHMLVGPNWIINLPDSSHVELLQAKLGGKPLAA